METFQKDLQDPPADPLIPAVASDGHILNIGIADAVTDRPPHSHDILSLQSGCKTVTACDQPGDQLRAFIIIARLPPPLRPVEVRDLPDLIFRGPSSFHIRNGISSHSNHFLSRVPKYGWNICLQRFRVKPGRDDGRFSIPAVDTEQEGHS
jgi:hypothetical protein